MFINCQTDSLQEEKVLPSYVDGMDRVYNDIIDETVIHPEELTMDSRIPDEVVRRRKRERISFGE